MVLSDCICFECHLLIQQLYSIETSSTVFSVVGMRRHTARCTRHRGLCSPPEGWSVVLCSSLCDFGIRATLLIALGSAHPFPYWVTNCYQGKRALYPSSGSLLPSFFSITLSRPTTLYPPIHAACCERLRRHVSLILKQTLISGTVWRGNFFFRFRKALFLITECGEFNSLEKKTLKIVNERLRLSVVQKNQCIPNFQFA